MDALTLDYWIAVTAVLCVPAAIARYFIAGSRRHVIDALKPAVTETEFRLRYHGMEGMRSLRTDFPRLADEPHYHRLSKAVQVQRIVNGLIIAWSAVFILLSLSAYEPLG